MTDFTPTAEQEAIVAAARETDDNLLVSALAGAAKTSTLVLIAKALPRTMILCLAFNKKIADEMRERLPGNCESMTLNSLGHRSWSDTIGQRLRLERSKTYQIVRGLIEAKKDGVIKQELYGKLSDIIKAVDSGKTAGYIPDGHYTNAQRLMDDEQFYEWLEDEPDPEEWDIIRAASTESIRRGFEGEIDFNDQILLPTVFQSPFPRYPLVLIDEAQDLSALNHATLHKLAKKRLIAVGDPCQAIYGFRGAHEDSMAKLANEFDMTELSLTISFRCPQAVVKEAQWRAPAMQWPEWAELGSIRHLDSYAVDDLPDHAAVICRNNAPIFAMAIRFLKSGRGVEIMGRDVGKSLIRIMRKFSKDDKLPQDEVYRHIEKWRDYKLSRTRNPDRVHDQVDCMYLFADNGENLGQILAYATALVESKGRVLMMTGHKSKGLEFEHVYFLDEFLVRKEGQDPNLRYVIQTRAMKTLTYIESDHYVDVVPTEGDC